MNAPSTLDDGNCAALAPAPRDYVPKVAIPRVGRDSRDFTPKMT